MNSKLAMNTQELPYEKFERLGPASLSEAELLAIILRSGSKDHNVLEISNEVLKLGCYPKQGLLGLYDLSVVDLMSIKGIGKVGAVKLKALTELSMRLHKASAGVSFIATDPDSVSDFFMEQLRHLTKETVYLALLDTKAKLIGECKLSEGTVDRALISPREIFIELISHKAVNFILLHNHPSGDPKPSIQDIKFTEEVYKASLFLNIGFMDHIIIGDNTYYSFRKSGVVFD